MNDMLNNAMQATRIVRDAIEAANFRRHEAEVSQVGDNLAVSVRGHEDNTATNGTTVKELRRLCSVIGLTFEDGVRGESITHSQGFACISIKGVTLSDLAERIKAVDDDAAE